MNFTWRDGERTIGFGRGIAADAVAALGGPGYLLLTTPRVQDALGSVVDAAAAVQHVPDGQIPDLAAAALATAPGHERIVALGGGRLIDTAKAVAAALRVTAMAIPTTLSGAEMTRGHRHAAGIPEDTARVRCAVVVYDPALAASQPEPELAASALNALGHAVEGPCTVLANPVATLAANDATARLIGAFAGPEPDRDALALGALLAGYTIDSTGFGLHHVMAQSLVRCGARVARAGERDHAAAHRSGAGRAVPGAGAGRGLGRGGAVVRLDGVDAAAGSGGVGGGSGPLRRARGGAAGAGEHAAGG